MGKGLGGHKNQVVRLVLVAAGTVEEQLNKIGLVGPGRLHFKMYFDKLR